MRKLREHVAVSVGAIAHEILGVGGEVDVIAVFERSFYLLAPRGIVSICMADVGRGPINVLVQTEAGAPPWSGVVRTEMKAALAADCIVVHGGFIVNLATAQTWSPEPVPRWTWSSLSDGLDKLGHIAPARVPADGLASLVFASIGRRATSPTAIAAQSLIADIKADLPMALATQTWSFKVARAAILLIGLGPGLTPSGDDFLGGVMLALTARGEIRLRDALWELVVDELNDLTVPVSAMHLTAAADGMGAEAMHLMLNALLTGNADGIDTHLDAVARIGATSGWDALAGMVICLASWKSS